MRETKKDIELSVQPSSQPEPERGLRPPPRLQLPTQDPPEAPQQAERQPEPPLPESEPEQQQQQPLGEEVRPVWIKHRKLLSLIFLCICSCAAAAGLVYYLHHVLQPGSEEQAGLAPPCLSPACQRASTFLSMSADPFTQPCDYFLSSCGSERPLAEKGGRRRREGVNGHPQNRNEEASRSKTRGHSEGRGRRSLKEEKTLDRKSALLQFIREILGSSEGLASSAVQKAKGFYRSCLDTDSIENAGVEPFLTLIQKLGGWAVSGQWNHTDFNSTLGLLMRNYSTFPFFNLYVGRDPNDVARGITKRYIQIDQPNLLIPTEWNSKTEKSQAKTQTLRPFLASCQSYLALLGAPRSSSMIHVGMFISLSSELAVATAPLPHRLAKGQLHERMTIKELQSQAPAIDWLGCLRAAFHPLQVAEDNHVLLHNLPYIVQMSHVIGKWLNRHELSSSGPLQTYMLLNLLHTLMPALDSRFSDTAKNLSLALGDTEGVAPRWRQCVLETERGFDLVLTRLLRETTTHKEAEEMVTNIYFTFKSKLKRLHWKDTNHLQKVIQKVESLTVRLGSTEETSSEAELNMLFSKVTVGTQSFFSNYIQLLSLWQKRRSKLLTEQDDKDDILSVEPFVLGRELIFPMGMFVPRFFHPTFPRAVNYGLLGFLMAKDLLHLFLPKIYSESETVSSVGKCVWAHYLAVTEEADKGRPRSLSAAELQEVWVQYFALQIALQAYHQSLKARPADTSISGLSHTHLFLTSFSQVCDSDPYREFMPLEPSFLITTLCAKSKLCPTSLKCPKNPQNHLSQKC